MNLRFYEHLAHLNHEALKICKHLQEKEEIHEYFLRNGFVKVIVHEGESPHKVRHPEILRKKFDVPTNLQ